MKNLSRFFFSVGTAVVLIVLLTGMVSCDKHDTEPFDPDFGYEYFPLKVGQIREFAVDSIIFDPAPGGTRIDTNSWLIQEAVVDSFPGQDGLIWYRIERLQRQSDTLPWQIGKVFAEARNERQAFRTEDNLRFIKMTFPLKLNESWDGNTFFSKTTNVEVAGEQIKMFIDWDYRILELGSSLQVGEMSFQDVCAIQLANSENFIEYRQGVEHYAKNIGLVYRELQILDTQCEVCCNGNLVTCSTTNWNQKAEKGFILRQRLLHWQ